MTSEEQVKRAKEIQQLLKNAKTPVEWLEAQILWFKELSPSCKTLVLIKLEQFECEKCPLKHLEIGTATFIEEKFSIEHPKNMTAISMLELSKQKLGLRELGFSFDFPIEIEEESKIEEENESKGFVN